MTLDRLLNYYEKIADASDAIPRLRRFILGLAVRGKLVPQDPKDEPTAELLKRIAAEKARLIKEGELRKPRKIEWTEELEVPFPIPRSWAWHRLSDVGAIIGGGTPSAADADNFAEPGQGIAWLTPADLGKHDGICISHGARDLSKKGFRSSSATLMPKGSVLFTSRAPIGYVAIADNEITTNQGFKSIVPYVVDSARYIAIYFQAFGPEIDAQASGTTFREVSGKIVSGLAFTVPPLAEQHRIVAKVDELMALCDRLEAARKAREAKRDQLAAASLARLNVPDPDPAVFQNHAAFTLDNLTPLTIRPDQIKALRQTILNLAVRGKLAPQDLANGAADDLLEKIASKRREWEDAKRVRKSKSDQIVPNDEKYLEIPESWAWARLVDIGLTQTGTSPSSSNPDFFGDFIPFVKPADLDGATINYAGGGLSEEGIKHSRLIPGNSALMVCIGATLGKVNKNTQAVCCNQQINTIAPFLEELVDFIVLALKSSGFQELAWSKAGTGTLPIISKGKWEVLAVPLPPLAEQHRIVAKVDELMALCDRLEASLDQSAATRRRLLDALLAEALAPSEDVMPAEARFP